ncbi:hypothetical protein B0H13DRAFT_1903844 [Mycena leptocephala]|nr:hypothetical protein B0H13DRAFT_1903844 [Mycena leptocephala]
MTGRSPDDERATGEDSSGDDSSDEDSSDESNANVRGWQLPNENDLRGSGVDTDDVDSDLATHMGNIFLLQCAKGRMQTNHLFKNDPAVFGRAQKSLADLMTRISEVEEEHEEVQAEITLTEQQLRSAQALMEQLQEQLIRLEPSVEQLELHVSPTEAMHTGGCAVQLGDQVAVAAVKDALACISQHRREGNMHRRGKKLPAPTESPEHLARWIQDHKSPIKGVPACAPDWVVDLRNARGHQVLMTLAPPGLRNRAISTRNRHRTCFLAMLGILIRPGAYAEIIKRISAPIADAPLAQARFDLDKLQDDVVARNLAAAGLTVAIADDCWQFCLNFAEAEIKSSATGYDRETMRELVTQARATVAVVGEPRGIRTASEDVFPAR